MTEQEGLDGLEGLRGLHQDLIALSVSKLPVVERLWAQLDARVDEFRKLLDQTPKSELSRKTLRTGETSRQFLCIKVSISRAKLQP